MPRRAAALSCLLILSILCPRAYAAEAAPAPDWRTTVRAERAAANAAPAPLSRLGASDVAPKTVRTNPDRSYPPSCLSLPLPGTATGPAQQKLMSLADVDGNDGGFNGQFGYFENVQITVWRVACSSGKSAVVVALDRPSSKEATFPAPDVPAPYGTQTGRSNVPLRIVLEPNTAYADNILDSIYRSDVYVLETVAGVAFDFNAAFTLGLDTFINGTTQRTNISVPAYNPATNPGSSLALELSGYLAGTWYDTAHGGEGIVLDIGERADGSRFAFFSWFTYDQHGFPYWIAGNADIPAGARTLTIPALYFDQGGFAGAFTPPLPKGNWGNVTFTFPSCNTLTLQYASTHSNATAPIGSGTRTWSRLTGVNGFSCE